MANEKPQYTVADFRKLEDWLSVLAGTWRNGLENRDEIKREYHEIVSILFSLGWDNWVDLEDELPDEHMPKEYYNRNLLNKTE